MNPHFKPKDLSAYIDGELTDYRAGLLKKHCTECETCRAEMRRTERVRSLVVESYRAGDVPEIDIEHAVMRRIRAERYARPFIAQRRRAAVIACVVIALAVIFSINRGAHKGPGLDYVETGQIERTEDYMFPQQEDWVIAAANDEEAIAVIIAALLPADMMEFEIETEEPWLDSTFIEVVETLTPTELEILREELYDYAIQG